MDNPLMTPNKIKRLIHLAEDRSFHGQRCLGHDDEMTRLVAQAVTNKSAYLCESSSGILDLERVEGFGESVTDNVSMSKSTMFNPGEMTGRSTGANEVNSNNMPLGRHSIALDSITSKMDKQTFEIKEVLRHSIATDYSFHSKRDLTADEASLVKREGLPLAQTTQTNFPESASINSSVLSVSSYFKNRCPEFVKMLEKTESPDRCMASITEVSGNTPSKLVPTDLNPIFELDQSLDAVPVRQKRENTHKIPEKHNINNPTSAKLYEKQTFDSIANTEKSIEPSMKHVYKPMPSTSKGLGLPKEKPLIHNQTSSTPFHGNKNIMNSTAVATDLLLKHLHSALKLASHDTEFSEESISISNIAEYLGKQSNVSVTDLLNNKKKQSNKKQPLTEKNMNIREGNFSHHETHVTTLKDSRKAETASSAGTLNTVISRDKQTAKQDNEVPEVVVTRPFNPDDIEDRIKRMMEKQQNDIKEIMRSKSPSSKSQSTLSTVQENFTSFKSGDSPLHSSKGEINTSRVPSPNTKYKELDKSVDWHELLQQKRLKQESLAKEQWADIMSTSANGFVGASCTVTITVTTLTESWLTAKFQFDDLPNDGRDLTIELPRLPLLLSPGKSEKFTLHLTSNVEMNTALPFTMFLKDASVDGEVEQKGHLDVQIKMPVIQAMSCDGVNKITFPPIQEKSSLIKSFVLLSDCPVDLQLDLSVCEGESIFAIKNVQEIKKGDVNKVLMDRQGSTDDAPTGKEKRKGMHKQLCRLTCGNAIRVTIKFNAPQLSDLQIEESVVTFNGALNVNLIGVNTVLRKVDLIGVVGSVNLVVKAPASKLHLTNDPTSITLSNTGSIPGIWIVKFKNNGTNEIFPFKVAPSKFEIRPGCSKTLNLSYTGPEDNVSEATLIFEDIASGSKTTIDINGGAEKPKTFPIKTNFNVMSWVRAGRKELSLKNSTNKKLYIRCQIVGDGYSIDLPGGESRGVYCLPFGPCECRPLPIVFAPTANVPQAATLHLVFDKNSDFSRKVKLYGCAGGESLRWSGLVTYGDTALVRAVARAPINLDLYNKSAMPAFVCARVHFNLQYMCASGVAALSGARRVVGGRARHAVALAVPWAAVERRARLAAPASALATITLLTGHEVTRRRILKVIRDESNGQMDTSLLPEHLKVLAGPFEGEDLTMDDYIADFNETKASLHELIGGLQELTAQIDLPQDFSDENTIIISDDSVIEHHTLCD